VQSAHVFPFILCDTGVLGLLIDGHKSNHKKPV